MVEEDEPASVLDLMAALKASVESSKGGKSDAGKSEDADADAKAS